MTDFDSLQFMLLIHFAASPPSLASQLGLHSPASPALPLTPPALPLPSSSAGIAQVFVQA